MCPNFGIQKSFLFPEHVREVFSGCPELKDGNYYLSDKPGWGIEGDEKAAA